MCGTFNGLSEGSRKPFCCWGNFQSGGNFLWQWELIRDLSPHHVVHSTTNFFHYWTDGWRVFSRHQFHHFDGDLHVDSFHFTPNCLIISIPYSSLSQWWSPTWHWLCSWRQPMLSTATVIVPKANKFPTATRYISSCWAYQLRCCHHETLSCVDGRIPEILRVLIVFPD